MKKLFALLLAVLMIASMAACGSDPAADNGTQPDANADFVRGVWDGNVYTNDFINLQFTMPEGWAYASDEELAEMMGVALDSSMDTTGISEEFIKAKLIYDILARDETYGTNVIVEAENLALAVGGTAMDEKDYMAAMLQQGAMSVEGLEIAQETEEVTIGDETYLMQKASLYEGVVSQCYLCRRVGKYAAVIIISYAPAVTDAESILAQFDSIK